jgi:hypothetical protein
MTRSKKLAAIFLPTVAMWGTLAYAQNTTPRKVYTNRKAFKLPIQVDDRERSRLQKIQLYVKTHPAQPWALHDTIDPNQREFVYHTTQDGEYWFTLVTMDRAGRTSPPDVAADPPGLIVVVDREPPEVEVQPVALGAGHPCLQCNVRDANPDHTRTKLEYQSRDRSWQSLESMPDQLGSFRVPDPTILRGSVRATAADRAGNVVVREINLVSNSPTGAADADAVHPVMLEPLPSVVEIRAAAAPPETKQASAEVRAIPLPPEPRSPQGLSEVRADKPANLPITTTAPARQFINTTQATLKYRVDKPGPSGIGKVDVWVTREDGEWHHLCKDPGLHNSVTINLPGDGVYGIRVVVTNGNGHGGEPPVSGDPPDWKLEVDTTKPEAPVLTARAGTGGEAGSLIINWTASDKNLRPEPIDLAYSNRPDGPWISIIKGLKNEGSQYRWVLPKELGDDIYVRMEVTDQAGNSTVAQTRQPVFVDRTRLKAQVIGVVAGTGDR